MGLVGALIYAVSNKPAKVDSDSLPFRAVKRLRSGTQLGGVILIHNEVAAALGGFLMINFAVYDQHAQRLDGIPRQVDIYRTDNIVALLHGGSSLLAHDLGTVIGGIHVLV